jgi:hypothetical protein
MSFFQCLNAECYFSVSFADVILLNAIIPKVNMLIVIKLNVILLSVIILFAIFSV